MSTHQLQALMFWTCYLCFGFNDEVIWMILQEVFYAVIRWWQLWTSRMLSWKCHNILLLASSWQDRHGLCSRTFLANDLVHVRGIGTCVSFWMRPWSLNFAVFNHVWHVLQNVPFSSMWMTSCTLVATTFEFKEKLQQRFSISCCWNRNLFSEKKDLACGRWFGFTPRQQHWEVDQGLGRKVWKAALFHNSRWSYNSNGGQLSLFGWKRCDLFQNGCGHMFVHNTWSTRCCFHGWRNCQATWATPQFQQWDTSRSLWLTWREPATMQLCFNNLMEDKACTSRPMTNTGFWSPFQTVTGAVTNDMDAPRPQVSIWYVVIWFTQAHVPKGWFLFQAAKLNYMEWFPPFVTASSSNVVLNLWSRAMSSAFCWLTLPVHARAQGRWSTWVPKYFGYRIKFEMGRLLWVKSAQPSMLLISAPRCCLQNAWRLFSGTLASLTMMVPTQFRQKNVEVEMPKLEPTHVASSQDNCTSCTSHWPWAYHWRYGFSSRWMCNWCFSWHVCTRRSSWWSLKVGLGDFVCVVHSHDSLACSSSLDGHQADSRNWSWCRPSCTTSCTGWHNSWWTYGSTPRSSKVSWTVAQPGDWDFRSHGNAGRFSRWNPLRFGWDWRICPASRAYSCSATSHVYSWARQQSSHECHGTCSVYECDQASKQGFAWAGDDTDPPPPVAPATTTAASSSNDPGVWSGVVYGEGGESESERTEDHLLNPERDLSTRQGELETSIDDLRLQLNVALAEEQWSDADKIQRIILMLLDHTHNQGMKNPETRHKIFQRIADFFRMIANRGERHNMSGALIARYRSFNDVYRSRTWQLILGKLLCFVWIPGNVSNSRWQ